MKMVGMRNAPAQDEHRQKERSLPNSAPPPPMVRPPSQLVKTRSTGQINGSPGKIQHDASISIEKVPEERQSPMNQSLDGFNGPSLSKKPSPQQHQPRAFPSTDQEVPIMIPPMTVRSFRGDAQPHKDNNMSTSVGDSLNQAGSQRFTRTHDTPAASRRTSSSNIHGIDVGQNTPSDIHPLSGNAAQPPVESMRGLTQRHQVSAASKLSPQLN
jgi:hypothetical protein